MIEIEKSNKNYLKFFNNLRIEDKLELKFFLKNDIKNKFLKILNNAENFYFLGFDKNTPCAIGGAQPLENTNYAQVWLLCANNYDKRFLYKYLKDKIKTFKCDYDILFNYIYKSNFKALKWLECNGFRTIDLYNKSIKFFYFKKRGVEFDIRYFTGK